MSDTPLCNMPQSRLLEQAKFFAGLSQKQRLQVVAISRIEQHAEGAPIYKIGDAAATFYLLIDGMIRFAISYGKRDAYAGEILRRGEVFGWAAITPVANVRIATASCMTPCALLAIDGLGLRRLMEQDHTLGFRLMTQLNIIITGTLTSFAGG